jgi:hypothetical protein
VHQEAREQDRHEGAFGIVHQELPQVSHTIGKARIQRRNVLHDTRHLLQTRALDVESTERLQRVKEDMSIFQ